MTKHTKNTILYFSGVLSFFAGVLLFGIKGMLGDYIDAEGVLHEHFYLLPMGYACIFLGVLLLTVVGIRTFAPHRKRPKRKHI